ncbi:MAG: hypothetical protein NWE96_04550 [Candidatus Bathyarchaeota archaeon]|nr:hypothetical protein [Candidatus Bathyarchaeota archaeon]
MTQGEAEKRDKLIYEAVNDRYALEWKRTDDLDAKANNLTGFAGLLATLTAGITTLLPKADGEYLFLIPLILFLFSALFGILASWITSFRGLNPKQLIDGYKDRTELETLIALTATTSEHTLHNFSLNGRKVRYISASFIVLILAVVSFFIVCLINWLM